MPRSTSLLVQTEWLLSLAHVLWRSQTACSVLFYEQKKVWKPELHAGKEIAKGAAEPLKVPRKPLAPKPPEERDQV